MRKILTASRYVSYFAHSVLKQIWAKIVHENVHVINERALSAEPVRVYRLGVVPYYA